MELESVKPASKFNNNWSFDARQRVNTKARMMNLDFDFEDIDHFQDDKIEIVALRYINWFDDETETFIKRPIFYIEYREYQPPQNWTHNGIWNENYKLTHTESKFVVLMPALFMLREKI